MKKQFLKISLLTIISFICSSLYANHHEKAYKFETIAEGLSFPWGIAFLSNDEILVTEKTGQLRTVKVTGMSTLKSQIRLDTVV